MIDVVSRNWNAVNWTEDTTCLRDPRRLYISNQLKTIKIALVQQLVGQSRRSLRLCSGLRVSFFFSFSYFVNIWVNARFNPKLVQGKSTVSLRVFCRSLISLVLAREITQAIRLCSLFKETDNVNSTDKLIPVDRKTPNELSPRFRNRSN